MSQQFATVEQYLDQLTEERRDAIEKLRMVFKENLPQGFEEQISYNMIGYVVPYSLYPKGYHCKPYPPLPFISIASQRHFIAVYHMGLYTFPGLMNWFVTEYQHYSHSKPDIGKSCIRFKKMDDIPFQLLANLANKISADQWIEGYEAMLQKKTR